MTDAKELVDRSKESMSIVLGLVALCSLALGMALAPLPMTAALSLLLVPSGPTPEPGLQMGDAVPIYAKDVRQRRV